MPNKELVINTAKDIFVALIGSNPALGSLQISLARKDQVVPQFIEHFRAIVAGVSDVITGLPD